MNFTTLLFVPGDSEKKQAKCAAVGADITILDLEDSVALARKQEARQISATALRDVLPQDIQCFVRVNALDTEMTRDDLAAILPAAPDGIILPKCNGPEDVQALANMMAGLEVPERAGKTSIIAIVTETAQGVLSLARGDAWAHPRLVGMMWGAEDLAADIGAARNFENGTYTEPFRLARNLCLLAARAAGVTPIDTVYADFRDLEGLKGQTETALRDGFDAKAAIHPAQVDVIAQAFQPDEQSIVWARAVEAAFADASAGVASLDGKMLDMPHLRTARKILSRAPKG
ncbi:CoA ester lyase [Parvularcula sp. IMCC14364]|uniref:HpcH/HpaI aldolase/citrate lyase family protein n=1 Tax=Parvularcula sp. IMCC14364 TaxID=3067902 RepID=UPI0027428C91|nr:CoA ester lyase [Parvularcula sp. IMCC14364]